jgi:chromosome partitioning protein
MKVIAVYNIKGGVGKTVTCVNLAYSCASSGKRTLVWDLDAQGAASFYLKVKPEVKGGTKKLFKKKETLELVRETEIPNLYVLPSDFSYRNMDLFLDSANKPKKQMNEFLSRFEDDYDVIFLDCPPSFSLVSENVFNASDIMLVPLIPTTLSLRTYNQILDYVAEHKKRSINILPFFSMVDRRKRLHNEVVSGGLASISGILHTHIPYLSIIENMGINQAPVGVFAARSEASSIFESLWKEVAVRAKLKSRN